MRKHSGSDKKLLLLASGQKWHGILSVLFHTLALLQLWKALAGGVFVEGLACRARLLLDY